MPRRFTPTVFFLTGGLLIWLANFVLVYGLAAVACARDFADARLAGVRLLPLTILGCNLLAGAATVILLLIARQRWRAERHDAHGRFLHFLILATCVIAVLALWFLAMPPLLIRDPC
jgi:hypothetical protein